MIKTQCKCCRVWLAISESQIIDAFYKIYEDQKAYEKDGKIPVNGPLCIDLESMQLTKPDADLLKELGIEG